MSTTLKRLEEIERDLKGTHGHAPPMIQSDEVRWLLSLAQAGVELAEACAEVTRKPTPESVKAEVDWIAGRRKVPPPLTADATIFSAAWDLMEKSLAAFRAAERHT